MYHPSHRVPDLDEAEEFFLRVFGRPSVRLSTLSTRGREMPDYSTFTLIADVLFDCIDPRRYVVAGEQRYPDVDQPQLEGMGWYVEGLTSLYRSLRAHGFTVVDQLDRVADGDDLFGLAVNLASRVCNACEPGSVFAASSVRDLAVGKGYEWDDLGEHSFKGFDEPVRVYRLCWS